MRSRKFWIFGAIVFTAFGSILGVKREDWFETRVVAVEPGRIFRGAWQGPGPLRRILARKKIKTVVTLTAINQNDPKYLSQSNVLKKTNVDWILIPMARLAGDARTDGPGGRPRGRPGAATRLFSLRRRAPPLKPRSGRLPNSA